MIRYLQQFGKGVISNCQLLYRAQKTYVQCGQFLEVPKIHVCRRKAHVTAHERTQEAKEHCVRWNLGSKSITTACLPNSSPVMRSKSSSQTPKQQAAGWPLKIVLTITELGLIKTRDRCIESWRQSRSLNPEKGQEKGPLLLEGQLASFPSLGFHWTGLLTWYHTAMH